MIIDCHGHYTTTPAELEAWRTLQVAALEDPAKAPTKASLKISDDQLRESVKGAQLKLQRERGTDVTIFSPRASYMAHHVGDFETSRAWSEICNELVHRVCSLYPDNFVGVCQLPQSPGVRPETCIPELERCVEEFGFVGCNLNPDPSGGHWREPPLTDRWWYPLYEKMVELNVPAMVHVSTSCNACFHTTGAHYLNADTTAFMQFLTSDLFIDFPTLKFIIPHGGGAAPLPLGTLPWPRARYEAPAAEGAAAEERVLRHLRLPPPRDRAAAQGRAGRQRALRLRDGRRGTRH